MDSTARERQRFLEQLSHHEWSKRLDPAMLGYLADETGWRGAPLEINSWDLYDRWILQEKTFQAVFFQKSLGQTIYMESDTNMETAGSRPGNRTFIAAGLALVVPRRFRERWSRIADYARVQLSISSKAYTSIPAAIVPVLDINVPIYKKVTREWKVPGKSLRTVTEERHARLYAFDPALIILPYRPFNVDVRFCPPTPTGMPPIPLMCVLSGWDIRSAL